jgi:hypothetical protein
MCLFIDSSKVDLPQLRAKLEQAANDKDLAKKFSDQFKNIGERSPAILVGFKAISEMILAKHSFNPISKVSHFKKGRNLLESAIAASPKNPELCFFRFTTQSNVPALLNYKSDLNADKTILINYLRSSATKTDADLFKRIKNYLLISPYCNAQERNMIKSL